MRGVVTNALMIGMAVAFLVHFCLVVFYGSFLIKEPNLAILGAEIAFMVAIIIFGAVNIVRLVGGFTQSSGD